MHQFNMCHHVFKLGFAPFLSAIYLFKVTALPPRVAFTPKTVPLTVAHFSATPRKKLALEASLTPSDGPFPAFLAPRIRLRTAHRAKPDIIDPVDRGEAPTRAASGRLPALMIALLDAAMARMDENAAPQTKPVG
ncbi:hypothetical protein [Mameliella alba]